MRDEKQTYGELLAGRTDHSALTHAVERLVREGKVTAEEARELFGLPPAQGDSPQSLFEQYVTESVRLRRVVLVGPVAERKALYESLPPNARVRESGPYTDRGMWPKCDPMRFRMVVDIEEE